MVKEILQDEILIDFGEEILYGTDQVYDSYPTVFQTVTFELMDTLLLVDLADKIRMRKGYLPFGHKYFVRDNCGWYNFYIGINNYREPQVDSCLEFVVVGSDSPDNEEKYSVDLTEEEKKIIFELLDEQCREELHKSCVDLLEEAK